MYILIIGLLLMLLIAAVGLLSMLKELVEHYCQGEPMFSEQGPIFVDQDSDQQPRSQFSWHSRSHSQGPD